jgi:endoglucanase
VALAVVLHLVGVALPFWPVGAQRQNPFEGRTVLVDPDSQARRAAASASGADRRLLERIADTPTAVWLTPEAFGVDRVEARARDVAVRARDADAAALLVLYGIADRDCSGEESAGGLPPDEYRDWVAKVADGLRGIGRTAVVLEPDALADVGSCADPAARTALLSDAVDVLVDADVTTYLDAGHSGWVDPREMADRLRSAGVDHARGFSTNVAFYAADDDERAYADAVVDALGDGHYVIDTGRNGNGSDGQWCNPSGRALGRTPSAGDGRLDAWLWIKPPGESDGECGGGPPAGTWWTERAVELARAAGW